MFCSGLGICFAGKAVPTSSGYRKLFLFDRPTVTMVMISRRG